jgi:hypothetical protein
VALNWDIVKQKADRFANELKISEDDRPTFSDGWLQKFLDRHGLKTIKLSGEAGSADHKAIEMELPVIQQIIAQYQRSNVFNMDETGLFYSMSPD